MKALVTGAALLLAIALPCSAQAQTADAPAPAEVIAVSYADLDLTQPAGSRILNNRLRAAAQRVCGDTNLVTSAPRARHWCVKDAVADGWGQVSASRSTRLAENRSIVLGALRTRPQP
ncbi:UrcA family protein [Brevundimonas sp.]|uniref:UrcA family protein n=1 Tax=Brevundimonas sp. TaxID=1871086 RepID=UPI003D6D3E70